jgi:hypothetical protein
MRNPEFSRSYEVIEHGFVTPTRFATVPGPIEGCVYRSDGSKVDLSERFGGYRNDWMLSSNPSSLPMSETCLSLPGRSVYLGHYMGRHYGHFLTETLSTFWIFSEYPAAEFDYFVFNPFVFGTEFPPFSRYILERFQIPIDRVIFAATDQIFADEIIVPERLLRLNHSVDSRLGWVYSHVAEGIAPLRGSRRIYLSRRKVSRRSHLRVCANEASIERQFAKYGFRIMYPEEVPFSEQIQFYRNAEAIAGLSGSALHNSVFMQRGSILIELGDPHYEGERQPTQVLCDSLSGVVPVFIPFTGFKFGPRSTTLFRVSSIDGTLSARFTKTSVTCGPVARAATLLLTIVDGVRLSIRPLAGYYVRKLERIVRTAAQRRAPHEDQSSSPDSVHAA